MCQAFLKHFSSNSGLLLGPWGFWANHGLLGLGCLSIEQRTELGRFLCPCGNLTLVELALTFTKWDIISYYPTIMRNGGQIQNFQQGKQLRTSINQYLFRKLCSNATIIQLPISKNTQILLLVLELAKKGNVNELLSQKESSFRWTASQEVDHPQHCVPSSPWKKIHNTYMAGQWCRFFKWVANFMG